MGPVTDSQQDEVQHCLPISILCSGRNPRTECRDDSSEGFCIGFECPNDNEEGGLFQSAPCSPDFCDCSFGVPYKLTCEDPLVFDETAQVYNWCYNMCDKCSDCGGCP